MVGATRSRELFMNRFKLRTDMVAMWESVLAGCESELLGRKSADYAAQGSMTILVTFCFLSRQTLYISGAWSRVMRWEMM